MVRGWGCLELGVGRFEGEGVRGGGDGGGKEEKEGEFIFYLM